MKIKLFALVLVALTLTAGTTYTTGTSHRFFVGTIPATTQVVIAGTVYVRQIVLINNSTSDVTVTVTDRAGNPLMPTAVTVYAKSNYHMGYDDQVCPDGIQWSASDGTNVTGRVHYRTTLNRVD